VNKFSNYLKKKKPLAKELISKLLAKYEFASILGTDVSAKNYSVDKFQTNIINSSINECGFVVRVYTLNRFFEYSFNELDSKNIDNIVNTIDELINSKNNLIKVNAHLKEEESLVKKFTRKQIGREYSPEEIISKLKELVNYGLGLSEFVINARASIEFAEYSKFYISANRDLEQYYTWINPRTFAMVKKDNVMKYAYDGFGDNDSDRAFKNLEKSMESTVNLAIELTKATLAKPGYYTIITDPSITGLIAHEAFGHGLEMDQFVKDRAKGQEYMGKEVGSKILNMHDGSKSAFSVASYFFDDEGALAGDTQIIKDGILVGGICDTVSASILDYHPTGNGRRESYKRKAYTRMTNTFFDKGKSSLEEMIASVDYGYYIAVTNNGMEDPKNWGIQCTALYGREIKDGKFTGNIVSPVVMSGYVIDLLKSISMVSKDNFEVCGSGSCGKGYKEWVRVSDGGASIKAEVKIG